MSRITKELAANVAKKQLQPKYDAISERKKEIGIECDRIRLERLPKDVIEVFEKYHSKINGGGVAFKTSDSRLINTSGHFVGHYGSYLPGDSTVSSNELFEKAKAIESDTIKLNQTRELLTDTIYNLRTIKNIQEHLPELIQHFPTADQPKNELVNFTELRNAIKHP